MRQNEAMYKPSFAGYVDVDLEDMKKLSLRSLVSFAFTIFIYL